MSLTEFRILYLYLRFFEFYYFENQGLITAEELKYDEVSVNIKGHENNVFI